MSGAKNNGPGGAMRNHILSETPIPYIKELRPLAGSVAGTILMKQLEYWFARKPGGFYKFLDVADHKLYKSGDSWSEELGFSRDEFRSAFDKIGQRWKSKTQFAAAVDKFCGKLYASYVDQQLNLTFYFRNHDLVDSKLNEFINILTTPSGARQMDNPDSQRMDNPDSLNIQRLLETEITYADNTTQLLQLPPTSAEVGGGVVHFEKIFSNKEETALSRIVSELQKEQAQQIIDAVAKLKKSGAIRTTVAQLASALVKRATMGEFKPTACIPAAAAAEVVVERQHAALSSTSKNEQDSISVRGEMVPVSRQEMRSEIEATARARSIDLDEAWTHVKTELQAFLEGRSLPKDWYLVRKERSAGQAD